jgi:alkylated DNA nucleotide flippase Atl1
VEDARQEPAVVEARERDEAVVVGLLVVVRVAEVPGQVVHVAEEVAARAGGLAVAARLHGVVEEGTAESNARWLRVVQRQRLQLGLAGTIDHAIPYDGWK